MKCKSLLISFLISLVCTTVFLPNKSSAEWAYSFVVWDGYVYVLSDEIVDQIDKEIGEVTLYSTNEGTYSGNFSNSYASGTKYFSIIDTSTDEAIAIEDPDGQYYKATRDGEYAGNKLPTPFSGPNNNDGFTLLIGLLALFPIIAFASYLTVKQNK
ncbi:hypothetical protein MHH33_00115 [Paenisporosarcina sp. FSL H8-0542]|uniref:hypothetical protein n=1 Tax=Paenisporosarcina sp. FSL H8-0542 TaxID=2921401 RepID=UPI00315A53E1